MPELPKINRKKLLEVHAKLVSQRVFYGYGAKPEGGSDPRNGHRWNTGSTGKLSTPVSTIHNIDCSGLVRYEAYKASSGKLIMPDGSASQRDWCEKNCEQVPYSHAKNKDNILRMGFLTPGVHGVGSIGHVFWAFNARTMESYGGHGVGTHSWTAYEGKVSKCFIMPSVSGVIATKPTPDKTTKHDPPILLINDKQVKSAQLITPGHWQAMDGDIAEILGYTTQNPPMLVSVYQAATAHGFYLDDLTQRLEERGRVDMRWLRH